MIEVIPKNNTKEAFEDAMNIFKKKVSKSGVVQELKDRRFYMKPGEKKRLKKEKAKRRKK